MERAQGTVEYLVIVAVVVVVGLAVVAVSSSFLGNADGISETTTNMYWKTASPFAVTEAAYDPNTQTLYITFYGREKLNYFNVGLDQNSVADSSYSLRSITRKVVLTNSVSQVKLTNKNAIIPKSLVYISYDSKYLPSLVQYAQQDILAKRIN